MKVSGFFEVGLHKLLFLFVLLLVVTGGVMSCSSGGDGGSNNAGTNNPTTNAVLNVNSQIANAITTAANGAAGAGADSDALANLLSAFGITLANNGNQGLSDDLTSFIGVLMNPSTSSVTQVGDIITIVPSPSEVCNFLANQLGFPFGGSEYSSCLQMMLGMTVVIDTDTANSGSLTVAHNGNELLMLQYSASELVLTLDLADMFAAFNSMITAANPAGVIPPLDALSGELIFTLTQLGVDHSSFLLQISQAVNVQDTSEGISFSQGASTLFFAEADGVTGAATVSSQLGAISAMLPVVVDDVNGTQEPSSFTMAAGTELTLNVTDGGAGLNGEVTVGATDFDINSQDEFDFFLDPSFTLDPVTSVWTLNTGLVLNVNHSAAFGLFGFFGTLDVTSPANSSFLQVSGGSPFEAIYEVQSGSVTFSGTGDFSGYTGVVGVGECFNSDGPVACPVMAACSVDVTGTWFWDVTNINSTCGPEPGWTETVNYAQTVCSLVVTNFTNAIGPITGTVAGNVVTIGPFTKQDGGGKTTATFTMTTAPNGLTMSGNESWTWVQDPPGVGTCIGGVAAITATKQ